MSRETVDLAGNKKNYHTRQQEAVAEYFRLNADVCVTADDIYLYFMRENSKIGKATIYRCLDRMVESGEIKKFISDSGDGAMYQLIDADNGCDRHFHLKCTVCGRIIHLDCGFMGEFEKHISQHHGFCVDNARTIIYGLCEECREQAD